MSGHYVTPGQKITARQHNLLQKQVDELNRQLDSLTGSTTPRRRISFWAEITGSSGTAHSWKKLEPDGSGSLVDASPSVTGTDTAYDANGRENVPTGTIVRMWRTGDDGAASPQALYVFDAGPGIGVTFAVNLTQDGGTDGDSTTAASWTYTANTLGGTQLGTALSPKNKRPSVGAVIKADFGTGYYDSAGTFVLAWVNEMPDAAEC